MQEPDIIEEYANLDYEKPGFKERFLNFLDSRYFIAVVIVLVAITSFFLGRISILEGNKEAIKVYDLSNATENLSGTGNTETSGNSTSNPSTLNSAAAAVASGETVVASKNGTKYHYPWCPGAKQISDKNKITFNSIEEARAAGYTPASNCKGLK